jgi:gliding motility-associated-like protein
MQLLAQREANIWYFGVNAGLDFNSGTPVALTNSVMNAWEGTATISDASGQLLFYTNGITVWNKNHVAMANGTGLNGDPSATSSAVIVPKPGSVDSFFVFTVDNEAGPNGIDYSIVNMSMNGGLGQVIAKNIGLSPGATTEKITAVRHCNGKDIWVIGHNWNSNQFYIWLVTEVDATPQLIATQAIGMTHNGSSNNAIGFMKASPNGRKLALATNSNNRVEIYDFDNLNGVLSNLITINNLNYCYGIEFSPDSRRLYVSAWYNISNSGRKIYQFDLTAANVPASQYTINTQEQLGAIQLGPDGKIYASRGSTNAITLGRMNGNNQYLGIITNPNALGAAVNYVEQGVYLGGRACDHGLPTFIQTYFNDTVKSLTYTDTCLGNATQFTVVIPNDADSMRLFFGDGQSSNSLNPSHTYQAIGSYTAKLMIYKRCSSDSIIKTLQIIQAASVNIIGNNAVCSNATGEVYSVTAQGGVIYSWTVNGGTIASGQGTASITVNWGSGGNASVTVTAQSGACSTSNTFNVSIGSGNPVSVTIAPDQNNVCSGTNITFTATPVNGGSAPQYQWLVNNIPVGGNSPTFSSGTLNNGDVVQCVLNSSASCVTGNPALSNSVVVNIVSSLALSISISATGLPACPGDMISFTANAVNAGANPVYQWKVNGNNVGSNAATFSSATLNDGDVVTCEVVSNDACVTGSPATSNAIVVATQTNQQLAVSIVASDDTICAGDVVTFTANVTNGGATPLYQWQINGNNAGTNSPVFTPSAINNGDAVSCIVTASSSCVTGSPATSNIIQITVIAVSTPAVSIQSSATTICTGENIVFDAVAVSTGASPQYEWRVNGIIVGSNSTQFSSSTMNNNDVISCTVISNDVCANPQSVTSNVIAVSVIPSSTPTINISVNKNPSCPDELITFTATISDAGNNPDIIWYVNGNVAANNTNVFSTLIIDDADEVYAEVVSVAPCASPANASSNTIVVIRESFDAPEVFISTPDNVLCSGSSVVITATVTNAVSPEYRWWYNNTNLTFTPDNTYTQEQINDGDTIRCIINTANICSPVNTAVSNAIIFSVIDKPTPVIAINDTLNSCKERYAKALTTVFDSYVWQTPEGNFNAQQITVAKEGEYSLRVVENGCESDWISVFVNDIKDCRCQPFFPNAFSPNGDGNNDVYFPVFPCTVKEFHFRIFDRWGEKVFEADNIRQGWNGTFNGKQLDMGVFVFAVTYVDEVERSIKTAKGSITLVK